MFTILLKNQSFPKKGDDPNYMLNLANTVDRALSDYDINVRQCLSNVMCKEMKKRGKKLDKVQGKGGEDGDEGGTTVTDMLGYGIIRQAAK